MKSVQQGDICLVDLNPVKGHEQAGYRPVIILQNNTLNRHLHTVVISPLTSNLAMKGRMTTYYLPSEKTNLSKDSVVMLTQIRTIDKTRLKKKVGHLDKNEFIILRIKMTQVFW